MIDKDKPAARSDDDGLLAEVREYVRRVEGVDSQDRSEAIDDLLFVRGDGQWPEAIKFQRQLDGRPCLTVNKLPTFLHQVTNDQRQNKPSIKVHPVDSGADPEVAEVLQGMIRHIEYDSNASVAYDTAVNSAAACGRGFFRLVTDYESCDSFDQAIKFERIRNAFTVYFDPDSKELDGSDAMRCALVVDVPKWQFRADYPDADVESAAIIAGPGALWNGWVDSDSVRVALYYRVEMKPATLVRLSNGEEGYKDDLNEAEMQAAGLTIVDRRKTHKRSVWAYKMIAGEVLERTEIPCKWIPVFPVWGDELDINGKVTHSGLIRHAKDPQRAYNFWYTSATEEVALRPKVPYIMAEGQEEGHEGEWAQANTRSFSYLTYKPTTIGAHLAPPPMRQPMADMPSGALQMMVHATDNIKATTGIFDASLGAKGNETSGRAIVARQREGDVANFHFTDNLNITIRHVGRCMVDMIPRVYDTPRVARILGDDEKPGYAQVNTPQVDEFGAVQRVMNDLSVGKYDVTVASGPSYTTLRQEAADAMIQFGQSWPKLMDVAGDKVVKALDWPGAEEIAERIAKTIPPEIRGPDDGEQGPQPLPPEVQQQLQQAEAAVQDLQKQLQEAQSGVQKARIDAQTTIDKAHIDSASRAEVAQINAQAASDVAELRGLIQMLVERMPPPPQLVQAALQTGEPEAPAA